MQRTTSKLAQSFVDAFGNRLIVPDGSTGANDEVIGERTNVFQLDNDNVLGFLVQCSFQGFGQLAVLNFLVNGFYLMNKVCVFRCSSTLLMATTGSRHLPGGIPLGRL
jgi:hypothetical protein